MNPTGHLNCESKKAYTPLHIAAMNGSISIIESLIHDYGVEKEMIDYKNRTPLHVAAEYSNLVLFLLSYNNII